MKRILSIFKRDFKSSVREFLLLYIIIAPILLAVGLRFFIPSVNSISLQFALDSKLDQRVVEEFSRYGRVEIIDGIEAIKSRVNKVDDIVGVMQKEDGKYQLIMEGNEKGNYSFIPQQIISNITTDSQSVNKPSIAFSSIGINMPPIAIYGSSSIILMAIIFSGMVIGLNIIEEKEAKTIEALNVTPMQRLEFIAGKCLTAFTLPVFQAFIIIWILKLNNLNYSMLLIMTIASSFIAIIFGFLIGILSSNQIAGIANFKFLLLFVSASFVGAVALPASMQKFLYWSPLYWSTIGLINIVKNTASWLDIWTYSISILGLTFIIFIMFKGKIKKGLSA